MQTRNEDLVSFVQKKQIDVSHTQEGIDCNHKPAGQGETKEWVVQEGQRNG
jgi:hypothetical protein